MEYFVAKSGSALGPLSREQVRDMLANGSLRASDLVWLAGQKDWANLGEHPDFSGALPATANAPQLPPLPEDSLASMYEAYIGPVKASYYLPLFARFDAGGSSVSWNWAAAFFTQLWMLYRGMYLWGFLLYPILGTLASVLIFLALATTGDSLQAMANVLALPLSFIVMGMFSNKLLHAHVRSKIAQSGRLGLAPQQRREWLIRRGAANGAVFFIVLLIIVAIIGILAAIAIPAYQDFVMRAKVHEGAAHLVPVENAYGKFLLTNHAPPASMEQLGQSEDGQHYGSAVASVTLDAQHDVRMTFSGPVIGGKALVLTPTVESNGVRWTCSLDGLPGKYAPLGCPRN